MSVIVNYRSDATSAESACREAEERGAARTLAIQADVADLDQGRVLLDRAMGSFGRIDLWVNNAGIAPPVRLDVLEATPESWDLVLGTNLRGPFFLAQRVARKMLELQESIPSLDPQIIFITSISSTFASTSRGEYCVSKAGLSMVVQLFAARLAHAGVRVYEIRPGIIASEMTDTAREIYDRSIAEGLVPIARWGTPADVGRAVAALATGALRFSTGEVIHVDGGLHLRRL
jgi:NAD(P)-dependent dehydrogenase (short-subunit alcohol dehydrogenase family)